MADSSSEEGKRGYAGAAWLAAGAAAILALLGLNTYFYSKPKIVYETRASAINLPPQTLELLEECLAAELLSGEGSPPDASLQRVPNAVASVDIWNDGKRPATEIDLRIRARGPILDYNLDSTEPGITQRMAKIGESSAGGDYADATRHFELSMLGVPRLAPGKQITLTIWWRTAFPVPSSYLDLEVEGSHADGSIESKASRDEYSLAARHSIAARLSTNFFAAVLAATTVLFVVKFGALLSKLRNR